MKKISNPNTSLKIIFASVYVVFFVLIINVVSISVFRYHPLSNTYFDNYISDVAKTYETIVAKRGTIYDANGIALVTNADTYDIICYLSPNRKGNVNEITYVDDPLYTAQILAPILNMDQDEIYSYLTVDNLYQTELGIKGRNLSKEKKEEIESIETLHGIDFKDSKERNYVYGSMMSPYLIGFAQSNEGGKLVGKMGVEQYLDEQLSGVDGSRIVQKDKNGYNLEGMYSEVVEAIDGNDVYLTIDKSIQDATSTLLNTMVEKEVTNWGFIAVAEVKTGKILSYCQTNDFDPNLLNIEDYTNYLTQFCYEPGSTFKSIVYSAAINEGVYDENITYDSAAFYYNSLNNEPIRTYNYDDAEGRVLNWDKRSHGMVTYDYGFANSLNTATSSLLVNYVAPKTFIDYVYRFGFFQEVNTDGLYEESGTVNYLYPSEKLALTYGQGSSITALQLIQAYTAIFGNGDLIKPYFVDKIVNPETNEIVYKKETEIVRNVMSQESAKHMQDLLRKVVIQNWDRFGLDEVELIGKTGTGEIFENGKYSTTRQLTSEILGFPYEDPEYMIYIAYEKPYGARYQVETPYIKDFIKKVAVLTKTGYSSNYVASNNTNPYVNVTDYTNYSISDINLLVGDNLEVVSIGDGQTVIDQYPKNNSTVLKGSKLFLLTSKNNITLPDFKGYTRLEIINYWSISGLSITLDGYGIVNSQNIPANTIVNKQDEIIVYLSYDSN